MSFSKQSAVLRQQAAEWTLERCAEVLADNPDGVSNLLAIALGGVTGCVQPARTDAEKRRLAGKLGVEVAGGGVVRIYAGPSDKES